jgi:N-acetylmuramoyl-L-alanine amidase
MESGNMKPVRLIIPLFLALAGSGPGGETETLLRPPLEPGTVIRLSQVDPSGYRTLVGGEAGPGILLTFPPVEMTTTPDPAIRLAGRLAPGNTARINGEPVTVYPTGSFVALVPLAGGENTITVAARDLRGETVYPLVIRREAAAAEAEREKVEFHPPLPGRVGAGPVPLRSLPAGPRILTVPEDAILRVTGREGNWLRADLGGGMTGWIPAAAVELGEGPPPEAARVGNVGFDSEKSQAWFPLSAPVPARIDYLSPEELDLVFHQAAAASATIDLGEWEGICLSPSSGDGTAVFRLRGGLACHRWSLDWLPGGYRLRWRGRPRKGEGPVCLDPGHGGDQRGAVGPSGVAEKDANLALARAVAARLEEAGVEAFLTRGGDQTLNLAERTEIARERGAALFISLHYNSTASDRDPLAASGYTIFYYHPPGRELAGEIHHALKEAGRTGTGVRRQSLAVLRPTDLVTALVETAYLSHPEDEAEILDPAVRKETAAAIAAGVLGYLVTGTSPSSP